MKCPKIKFDVPGDTASDFRSQLKVDWMNIVDSEKSCMDLLMEMNAREEERILLQTCKDIVQNNPHARFIYFYTTTEGDGNTIKTTFHFLQPDEQGRYSTPSGITNITSIDLGKYKAAVKNGTIKVD